MLVDGDKIIDVGTFLIKPTNAIEIDCEGKTIVPAFIDLSTEIGIQKQEVPKRANPYAPVYESERSSNFSWNDAIRPELDGSLYFKEDPKANEILNKMGFGFALTHNHDGIARGTGLFVSISNSILRSNVLQNKSSAHFSFSKGSSQQAYPSSQMGAIALLRQTFYDCSWYKSQNNVEPNIALEALKNQFELPLFFSTEEAVEILRAAKIANEFNLKMTYIGTGNEYQFIEQLRALKSTLVIPLSFPKAIDVSDPYINMEIPLSDLKHWELAPSNAYFLASSGIDFCFSANGCKNEKEFWTNLRLTMERGLSFEKALAALTTNPAKLMNQDHQIGTLEKNKVASFSIYNANPFLTEAKLMQQWLLGEQTVYLEDEIHGVTGNYNLLVDSKSIPIEINQKNDKYSIKFSDSGRKYGETLSMKLVGNDITIQFKDSIESMVGLIQLHGKVNTKVGVMEGEGILPSGRWIRWSAVKNKKISPEVKPLKSPVVDSSYVDRIWYPSTAFGVDSVLQEKTYVIKNVTAWTNEQQGILKNATVIVEKGKITFVGDGGYRTPAGAIEIEGKGMHLTSGIIDEHSHIAISKGVNEGGQAIAAEVSIQDVVRNDDINIYRQLAGGVTVSQLLHGSADPIGGQSAIIKLKWGYSPEEMLVKDAPKFIKFALGENVKQSNWGDFQTIRFPQTRMGVEQVYIDAFTRAKIYQQLKDASHDKKNAPRVDLELEVLCEILNHKRFITCHSYVQSEINMLMHVADTFGFKINTFTHILEGYKVADKMAQHGAGGSTFADWWAYKMEVKDAIPYNAKMMHDRGVVVAINSDDAEMGRRLNQEAAKTIKYGGMSEEDAWKLITLNPAKLLHLDDRIGSIKVGKDADLVLWTANPLSIEAIADKVFIDGIQFFDRLEDAKRQLENQKEKARIIEKMALAKLKGEETKAFEKKESKFYHCDTLGEEGTTEHNGH